MKKGGWILSNPFLIAWETCRGRSIFVEGPTAVGCTGFLGGANLIVSVKMLRPFF
jgi:hypothetical protein